MDELEVRLNPRAIDHRELAMAGENVCRHGEQGLKTRDV